MTGKALKLLLAFLLFVLIAAVGLFMVRQHWRGERRRDLVQLISELEAYKSKHGAYPANLTGGSFKNVSWIFYETDSTRNFFHLAYPEGIMKLTPSPTIVGQQNGKRNLITESKLKQDRGPSPNERILPLVESIGCNLRSLPLTLHLCYWGLRISPISICNSNHLQ